MAAFLGIARKIPAMTMLGKAPTLISGVPKRAVVEATARCDKVTRAIPPATAAPLTFATTGFCVSYNAMQRSR